MSFRSLVKEGWQPKGKDGGKESWRGDFKGINQVAGWMGKGRDPNKTEASEHVSRPLTTLKDPALFGPPPKNVNYHGGAALPNEITPHTGGLGAPLRPNQTANRATPSPAPEEVVEEERPAGPPLPYRADRTGLRTDHLPPPPVHREVERSSTAVEKQPHRPKPGLPPRLPSRQNTMPTPSPPPVVTSPPPQAAPPAYEAVAARQSSHQASTNYGINQGAVNRLANAGVSVPALGIGSNTSSNPWQSEKSQTNVTKSPSPQPQPATSQLSEIQARFARMNSNTGANGGSQHSTSSPYGAPAQSPPPVSTPGTAQQQQPQANTWAEKQATFRTAQNLHRDPSSVSVADAQSAAKSVNAFRSRHQDSINKAGTKATELNKKYNVAGRLNSFLEKHSSPTSETPPSVNAVVTTPPPQPQQPQNPEIAASLSRKPPPPPPPKKPATLSGPASPPPVPLGTKPSFG
ncbi:hypothetical protein EDD36DRAFT_477857 [Exophiala viscosa]|uniref:Uncharacterized protein n=1 Tax=Exophiala viscosa TaxID=2486360 RepID=A0AAN6I9N7_9EURO|nr:hypothetical protein EDD36DRAFT_477857 [Exophiala viscosa]